MNLAIQSWCAWQPEDDGTARCRSFSGGQFHEVALEQPALRAVPAMQKRRLSPLARVVFHVLDCCAHTELQAPVVFSSVMGEIKRTQGILEAMATGAAVSPAAFSLSVHNSIGGLWSLIRDIKAPMLALAPTGGSPVAALLEAAGLLHEGRYKAVYVVFYDEDFPLFYAPFLRGPTAASALALKLVAPSQDTAASTVRLDLTRLDIAGEPVSSACTRDLVGMLCGELSSMSIAEPQCHWRLGVDG